MVPHALQDAMVLGGLWGLAALLLPTTLHRLAPASAAPRDEHDRRVAALRVAVGTGTSSAMAPRPPSLPPVLVPVSRPPLLCVPLALVASATAGAIHLAVAPAHLQEQATAGVFFVVVAGLQLTWAGALTRPTTALLRAGIVLHVALITLWTVTRTVGLPFGPLAGELAQRHSVGAWDLACVSWQLTAVVACACALRPGARRECPGWFDWHPSARAAVGAAATSIALLTLLGAHS